MQAFDKRTVDVDVVEGEEDDEGEDFSKDC